MNRTLNRIVARFESAAFLFKLLIALIIIYPVSWLFGTGDEDNDDPMDVVYEH
jgi:hypothetical protein